MLRHSGNRRHLRSGEAALVKEFVDLHGERSFCGVVGNLEQIDALDLRATPCCGVAMPDLDFF
jgi:hypothetical protein